MYQVAVITASDKGAKGERTDKCIEVIKALIEDIHFQVADYRLLSDDKEGLVNAFLDLVDKKQVDLILTTGGTGFSPRDNTPEATLQVAHKLVPGIPEAMRVESLKQTNRAMLSRGVAVIRHQTLIINLPGSPKAVRECLEVIRPVLPHAMEILTGKGGECGGL